MPLPTDAATVWSPKSEQQATTDVDTADAWWSGDPGKLAKVYGGTATDDAHEANRPSRLASWF